MYELPPLSSSRLEHRDTRPGHREDHRIPKPLVDSNLGTIVCHNYICLLGIYSLQAWSPFWSLSRSAGIPAFSQCFRRTMTTSSHYPYPIPNTPRVTSPSPTPSESGSQSKESYFGPVTRSISRAGSRVAPALITEEQSPNGSSSDSEKRSRPRRRPAQGSKSQLGKVAANIGEVDTVPEMKDYRSDLSGHLSPVAAYYMIARGISRSPSPLGLIPIHRHWKSFVCIFQDARNARLMRFI